MCFCLNYSQFDYLPNKYDNLIRFACVFRLINTTILLPAFMSLAGGNLSILHPGVHLLHLALTNWRIFDSLIMLIIFLSCRWKGESLRESIKRHEHFLPLQLGLKPGQKVFIFNKTNKQADVWFTIFYFLNFHEPL